MVKLKSVVILVALLLSTTLLYGCNTNNKELSGTEIFNKLSDSTVEITASNDYYTSTGSGFFHRRKWNCSYQLSCC